MNERLIKLCEYLQEYAGKNPGCTKSEIEKATAEAFGLQKRSVYFDDHIAIYFSSVKDASFSNSIRGLSTLRRFDDRPFVVCIVRPTGIQLMLANSTFLKKISHSSHRLRIDNVRGTFNGTDIFPVYSGLNNSPDNFDSLFDLHTQFSWDENLARLVEATNAIVGVGQRFDPSDEQITNILKVPLLAREHSQDPEYRQFGADLTELVNENIKEILEAASIDGSKERGDCLEQIITKAGHFNSLQDVSRTHSSGLVINVDIKTKVLNYSSSPKAYNIEKTLRSFSSADSIFSFFFIGIDRLGEKVQTCLVSTLDQSILDLTGIQFHWAGRNSRGVTQLSGNLDYLFEKDFVEIVDVAKAQAFLKELIELPISNQ